MKCLLLVLLPALVWARRAFPVGVDRATETIFQEVNPKIKWDDTNYLVDEAGPYAVCENEYRTGILPVDSKLAYSKLYGANGVGALIDRTRTTGTTVSGAKRDIYTIVKSWVNKYPFTDQIKAATSFGCSVQPGCKGGNTIVVCLFSPKLTTSGDEGDKGSEKINAVAYTPEEYRLTEDIFRQVNPSISWDRSNFLENLSGTETKCSMIGKARWDWSKPKDAAEKRGHTVDFMFSSTPRRGNTDEAVKEIARGWTKSQWKLISQAKQVGCSLAVGCNGRQDILVASCLVKIR